MFPGKTFVSLRILPAATWALLSQILWNATKTQIEGSLLIRNHRVSSPVTETHYKLCTIVHTSIRMDFEWDLVKAKTNLLRHGVNFADAATSFDDRHALTVVDPDLESEERFLTVAQDVNGRVLVTCFAFRGDAIRIISSRKASRGERHRYEMIR